MPLNDAVPSQAFDVLQRNAEDLDKYLNQDSGTITNRTGDILEPIPSINNQLQAALAAVGYIYKDPDTFTTGSTLNGPNAALRRASDGEYFRRIEGPYPYTVTAGTDPTADPLYVAVGSASLTEALINGTAQIGNVTAAQVAEATDIAIGNFVTPEQYFAGNVNDPNADWLSACVAALAAGRRVLLSRMYGLSATLNIPANAVVTGLSRETTGFVKVGANVGTNSLIALDAKNITLSNFKVDCADAGSSPSNRLNAVAIGQSAKGFSISKVDVYDATGYGHVTFGSESNPQVEGVYTDCYAENCQVLFEQIGALNVTLYSCNGLAVAGRTLDIFHPYAGSKRVTYVDCHGRGVSGSGVNIAVTNGFPIGPITFINSSIDMVTSATSAIVTGITSGSPADVEINIIGGSYKSAAGAAVLLQTPGKFKAIGAKFIGVDGFNCPALTRSQAYTSLTDCDIATEINSGTATGIALITNGNNPIIKGGTILASNPGGGGAVAVSGLATISKETILTPSAPSSEVSFIFEIAGVVSMTADTATLGFAVVNLPLNTTRDKIIASFSISRPADVYTAPYGLTWALGGGGGNVLVKTQGIDVTGLSLHYRIGVLP